MEAFIRSIRNLIQKFIAKFQQKDESEVYMKARDLGVISDEFDKLYDRLTSAEDDLRDIVTKYTIGEADVRMIDVDASFSDMKKAMKEVRDLAVEARSHKEEDNDN